MTGVCATWMQLYWSALASPHPSSTTTATCFPLGSFGWSGSVHENPELAITNQTCQNHTPHQTVSNMLDAQQIRSITMRHIAISFRRRTKPPAHEVT